MNNLNQTKEIALKEKVKWTLFWDMHSGGECKEEPYDKIYIEAPKEEAKIIFYNRFRHNPERVTCTCCGEDYSISESNSLEQASGFHRGCFFDKNKNKYIEKQDTEYAITGDYKTINEYKKKSSVLVIAKNQIKPEEKIGEVPEQGYIWKD